MTDLSKPSGDYDPKKKVDLEKLRSIGHMSSGYKKSKKVVPHLDDQGKKDGGSQTYHFDGRVDAHIKPKAVRVKGSVQQPGNSD